MPVATTSTKYRRMRLIQEHRQWDIESDIPWQHLDRSRSLLPCGPDFSAELGLSPEEELAVSQLLGLMAVQSISEHEKVLAVVKERCWQQPLKHLGVAQDVIDLGEQFFKEEAKHATAFARYVDRFATTMQINPNDLRSILPTFGANSVSTHLFRLNSFLGGRAVWWLVMITEEESLALFRQIRADAAKTEPLFYELNRQHYAEEIRHMSYAPLMLRTLGVSTSSAKKRFMKFDYVTAEILYVVWLLRQVRRLRQLRGLAATHPFFNTLLGVVQKFERLSFAKKVEILLQGIPCASESLNPGRHRPIKIEIKRNGEIGASLVQRCLGWLQSMSWLGQL